ncbi:MAG: hypothetical protein MJ198_10510 [Bacteroidales bacterium]|nr:hypothetical protein [Bacteroidales bacterium]
MSRLAKIVVTILVVMVFIVLFAAIDGVRQSSGAHTPGILGLIVFAGMIGAIRAIWKK